MSEYSLSSQETSPTSVSISNTSLAEVEDNSTALNKLLSTSQSELLELIDSLKSDQLDRYDIDLPQIIVCGDQSCGKSSVLEAISRLNFPRGDLVCTTFATELTLRRESVPGIAVKIRWEDGSVEVVPKSQSIAHFGELIVKAGENLRKRYQPDREKPFYRDVLQVEVCDPTWPPLTLVDLPGLIHGPNDGQDKRDIKIAEDITKIYMKKSKTIILAVVSAASNAATQKVLTLAKTYDPTGERTMGIITKPDKLEGSHAEAEWTRIAKNKSDFYKFGHGWHVVRNRGVEEMDQTFDERDAQELEFFSHSSWAGKLDQNQLGIDSLRIRLSKILEVQTRSTLPGIIKQLRLKLEESKLQLKRLGPSRLDMDEKQRYLSIISDRFQRLVYQATAGQYDDAVFGREESMKLRAIVTEKHERFVCWMEGWGHSFEEQGKHIESRCPPPTIIVDERPQEITLPDIRSRTELIEWIRQIQVKNRSRELPGFANWDHVNLAFRQQCRRWRQIATAHIEAAWKAACGLLHQVTLCATENEHTAKALAHLLIGPWMDLKRQALSEKLHEILQPYEDFHAITFNPEFIRKRNELYGEILKGEKETIAKVVAGGNGEDEPEIKRRLSGYNRKPNEYASSSSEILDLMHAYYDVSSAISSLWCDSTNLFQGAMRTFIDNVIVLAIEGCLMQGLDQVFTTIGVQDMKSKNPSLLRSLASEPKEIRRRRETLQETIDDLDRALKKCEDKLDGFDLDDYEISEFEINNHQPAIQVSSPHDPADNDVASLDRVTTPIHKSHLRSSSSTSAASDLTGHTTSSSINPPLKEYGSSNSSFVAPDRATSPYPQSGKSSARSRRAGMIPLTNLNSRSRSGSSNTMAQESDVEL